jgi:hypothetical protein
LCASNEKWQCKTLGDISVGEKPDASEDAGIRRKGSSEDACASLVSSPNRWFVDITRKRLKRILSVQTIRAVRMQHDAVCCGSRCPTGETGVNHGSDKNSIFEKAETHPLCQA